MDRSAFSALFAPVRFVQHVRPRAGSLSKRIWQRVTALEKSDPGVHRPVAARQLFHAYDSAGKPPARIGDPDVPVHQLLHLHG